MTMSKHIRTLSKEDKNLLKGIELDMEDVNDAQRIKLSLHYLAGFKFWCFKLSFPQYNSKRFYDHKFKNLSEARIWMDGFKEGVDAMLGAWA